MKIYIIVVDKIDLYVFLLLIKLEKWLIKKFRLKIISLSDIVSHR